MIYFVGFQGLFVWECSLRVECPSPKRKIEGSSPSIPTMERIRFVTSKDVIGKEPLPKGRVWHGNVRS